MSEKQLTIAQAFEAWSNGTTLDKFGAGAEAHFQREAKQLRAAFEIAMETLNTMSDRFGDHAYAVMDGHEGPEWYRWYRCGYGHAMAVASNAAGHGYNRVTLRVLP